MNNKFPSKDEALGIIKIPTSGFPSREQALQDNSFPSKSDAVVGASQQLQSRLDQTQPSTTPTFETSIPASDRIANDLITGMQKSGALPVKTFGDILASPVGQAGLWALEKFGATQRVILSELDYQFQKKLTGTTPAEHKQLLYNAWSGEDKKIGADITLMRAGRHIGYMARPENKVMNYQELQRDIEERFKGKAMGKFNTVSDIVSDIGLSILIGGGYAKGGKLILKALSPLKKTTRLAGKTAAEAYSNIVIEDATKYAAVQKAATVNVLRDRANEVVKMRDDIEASKMMTVDLARAKWKDANDALKAMPNDPAILAARLQARRDVRTFAPIYRNAKVELYTKVDTLSKNVNDLLKPLYDENAIRDKVARELAESYPIKDDISKIEFKTLTDSLERLKQSVNSSRLPSEAIIDMSKPLPRIMREADNKVSAIRDGIKLLDDYDAHINAQVKRSVLINNLGILIKPTTKSLRSATRGAYSGNRLKDKFIKNVVSSITHGETTKFEEMMLPDLENLYDVVKGGISLPRSVNILLRSFNNFTPDWMAFKRMGVSWLHSEPSAQIAIIHGFKETLNKFEKDYTKVWKETFGKRFGKDEDEMLSHIMDTGQLFPSSAEPSLMAKFTNAQLSSLHTIRNGYKKLFDDVAERAIADGKMLRNADQPNYLKIRREEINSSIKSIRNANKDKSNPLTESAINANKVEINTLRNEVKRISKQISDLPPVYVENYFPHKRLKENILNDLLNKPSGMSSNDWEAMKKDILNSYGRKAFDTKAPLNVNSPEFMKRLKDDTLFSRNARDVVRAAYLSELKKIYLEPALIKGGNFVFSLPKSSYQEVLARMYRRYAMTARGMEMKGDVTANRAFYAVGKAIEDIRIPQRFGIKTEYQTPERAFEAFTGALRQATMRGAMWGNLRTTTKNFFQVAHSVATIGSNATYAGWESMYSKSGRELMKNFDVMIGRFPLEAFDMTNMNTFDRIGMLPNQMVEYYINCASAGNGAVWKIMTSSQSNMVRLSEFAIRHGVDPKSIKGFKFWDVMNQAVKEGEFKDVMDYANQNIKFTQWSYQKHELPASLSSSMGKTILMFSNWTQNYFTVFLPQLWHQLVRGQSTYGKHLKFTDLERYSLITYASMMAGIAYTGHKLGFNMSWLVPNMNGRLGGQETIIPVSPPVAMGTDLAFALGGATTGALNGDNRTFDESARRIIEYNVATFTPAGVATRTALKVLNNEKPPQSIFLPTTPDQKVKGSSRRAVRQRR